MTDDPASPGPLNRLTLETGWGFRGEGWTDPPRNLRNTDENRIAKTPRAARAIRQH